MINIFVGNLDFATTEQELRNTFSPFGTIQSVSIVLDRDSGQPRGFAFVEMPNSEEAAKAVHDLEGSVLRGRPLRVNEAREKSAEHQKRSDFRGRDHRRHQL